MTTAQILLILGLVALLVLIGCSIVVGVARKLDGAKKDGQQKFADKMAELSRSAASAHKQTGGAPGSMSKVFASLAQAAADKANGDDDPGSSRDKKASDFITGLTISAVIIVMVVGAIVGD